MSAVAAPLRYTQNNDGIMHVTSICDCSPRKHWPARVTSSSVATYERYSALCATDWNSCAAHLCKKFLIANVGVDQHSALVPCTQSLCDTVTCASSVFRYTCTNQRKPEGNLLHDSGSICMNSPHTLACTTS
jgi:hypothetical protein